MKNEKSVRIVIKVAKNPQIRLFLWYHIMVELISTHVFDSHLKEGTKGSMKFLVCVLDGKNFNEVLKAVRTEMDEESSLIILNIASYEMYYLDKTEEEKELSYLYEKAVEFGAMVRVIRTNNLYKSLVNLIETADITDIFIEDRKEFRQLHDIDKYVREDREGKIRCTFLTV